MSVVTIIYEARCKHCQNIERRYPLTMAGTRSKKPQLWCKAKNEQLWYGEKQKACKDDFKL